jgi:predicted DNA-binding ribbon-helix-helix protein
MNNVAARATEQQNYQPRRSVSKKPRRSLVHRVCLHGHQTSLSLEKEYWYLLRRISAECGVTVRQLLEAINIHRNPERSLSSEIRVCVATYFARQVPQTGFFDPQAGSLFGLFPPFA